MVNQYINLNMIPGGVHPLVYISQFDNSRTLTVNVFDGSTAFDISDYDVLLRGRRPDNTGFEIEPDSVADNEAVFTLTEDASSVAGHVECEIVLMDDGTYIGSANFTIIVEPSPIQEDTEITSSPQPWFNRINSLRTLSGRYPSDGALVQLSSGAWHDVYSVTVPSGKWLMFAFCKYDTSDSSIRKLCVKTSDESYGDASNTVSVYAYLSTGANLELVRFLDLDEDTEYSMCLYTGGSAGVYYAISYQLIELI